MSSDQSDIAKLHITSMVSVERKHSIDGAPSIGLYFTTPLVIKDYSFPIQTGHAFRQVNKSPYEKNMHVLEFDLKNIDEKQYDENAQMVAQICKNSGIVFIIKDNLEKAKEHDADGIIIDATKKKPNLKKLRNQMGEDFIIGLNIGQSKEAAEKYITDQFIDYVTFDYDGPQTLELVEYWKSNSDIYCAVKGYINPQICRSLVDYGVNFIGCGEYIWEQEENIAPYVESISEAIYQALKERILQ
jgi:thiamine monophosphate synthase